MPPENFRSFQEINTNGWELEQGKEGYSRFGGSNLREHPLLHHRSNSGERPASQTSQEITLGENATRDSMVEGMLQLLNSLPDAEGPHPEQPPIESSFAPGGTSFSPSFLQRALGGHRRAQSSLATTSSSQSANQGAARHPPNFVSHSRNNTVTQLTYNSKPSAPATNMNAEDGYDDASRASQHRSKFSISGGSARKPSAASLAMSGPNSRTQSPARLPDSDAYDGNRRRSKSFNVAAGSVLNRSRPVPAEYHNFDGPGVPGRAALRKSISNPNHQSRMREEFPPDLPSDRPFPPSSYLGQYDHDRLSSRALSSPHMAADYHGSNMPSREPSSSFLGSNYASSVGSRTQGDARPPPKSPGKERPGFFRRMFGPSKNNVTADNKPPQIPPLPVDRRHEVPTAQPPPPLNYASSQPSPLPVPDSPVEPEESQRVQPPTLKQKSSFFRRRRKTFTDKDQAQARRDESPSVKNTSSRPSTSSLRQAMDQYMVHDPMADDFDLEQLENVRRNRPEAQDAYEFLRTTSPGMSTPQTSHAQLQTNASTSTVRPSTAAQTPRRANPPPASDTMPDVPGAFPVDAAPANKAARPVTSPDSHHPKDIEARDCIPPKSVTAHRQAKKAPPPLDVNATKQSSKSRWHITGRSGSEKGTNRVPQDDDVERLKRPENPRSTPSGDSLATEDYTSAKSIPVLQVDEQEDDIVSPLPVPGEANMPWSASDFEKAQRIWEAQADPAARRMGALELGEAGEGGDRLRVAFMSFFDFTGLNILLALRDLCARMTLKGETQQMDRIMAAFSERWCECNPHHGFKSEDVVHTICYSLLLLNTDLHIAELSEKMTQRQFVKNTVPTLRRMAEADSFSPDATIKPNRAPPRPPVPWQDVRSASPASSPDLGASFDRDAGSLAPPVAPSRRPISGVPSVSSPGPYDSNPLDASELLVNSSHDGSMKSWESAIGTILKEFYTSIRQLRLPLHGVTEMGPSEQPSTNSLSVVSSIMRRTGSVISKTPSDGSRGRLPELKSASSRWSSKNRSKQRLYASSTLGSSRTGSRTSLDDNSPWSPSASSTWSKSYGNTQTTMSTDSLASRFAGGADPGYQQSIGFANALSHAIIREERSSLEEPSSEGQEPLLEDQALELAGAPWAKEGIVQHKHHLETVDKKAKDRNWSECFAVVEKGVFRLFSFNKPKSSLRSPRAPKGTTTVVGGGNWMDSAAAVGTFTLRQTIANALPPPGYSKSRPYVFALSLPNGAVHLFQVGTPEIAREFVSTANYWSARLSKEPLMGGVSSIEYGWGESVINTALVSPSSSDVATASHSASQSRGTLANGPPSSFHVPRTSSSLSGQGGGTGPRASRHSPAPSIAHSVSNSSRPSLQGSLRSSIDAAARPARARMPADRIALGEWSPPQQSLMASALGEAAQLDALVRYVRGVEDELAVHNELRAAMALAFSARSVNAQRALGNWERKSSYLLREIVKFRTYVDVLQFAAAEARRVRADADAVPAAADRGRIRKVESDDDDDDDDVDDDEGLPEETLEALRMARQKARAKSSVGG